MSPAIVILTYSITPLAKRALVGCFANGLPSFLKEGKKRLCSLIYANHPQALTRASGKGNTRNFFHTRLRHSANV